MASLEPQIDEESTKLTVLLKIEKPLICEECGKSFSDHIEFAYHSRIHSNSNEYSCHLCFFNVNSKFRIRRHIKAHSGYKCQVCNKTFKRGRTALDHSYLHSGEKPYRCQICGKQLANPKSLDMHLYTIHHKLITGKPISKYDCPICKKHYESETGLRGHYSSTHREMGVDLTVICEVCGRRVADRKKLTRHMRTHTGQKPFPCSICNKSFATKCIQIAHMRIHTGEKPYVCSYCGKKFGHSAPYRYHVKIHTGDRKYICKLCGKGFISNSNLKIHLKSCYLPINGE